LEQALRTLRGAAHEVTTQMLKHTPHTKGGAMPPPVRTLVTEPEYDELVSAIKEDIAAAHRHIMQDLQNRIVELYALIIKRVAEHAE